MSNVPVKLVGDEEYCSSAQTVFCNNLPVAIGSGIPTVFAENLPLCVYGIPSPDTWVGS